MNVAKTPPNALEAEETVLGAILANNNCLAQVTIPPEAFYSPAHQHVFRAMQRLEQKSMAIDALSVANELGADLEKIGGIPAILNLMEATVSTATIDLQAAIIRQKWQRRKLINLCHKLIDHAYDPATDWDEIRKQAESELTEVVSTTAPRRGLTAIAELLPQVLEQLSQGVNPAIPTQLPILDQFLGGGLRGGELIVVAGRPGMGKTFVANYVSRIMAEQGPVAFFSMEMDSLSIVRRLWATEANIRQTWLTANSIPDDKVATLVGQPLGTLSALPIHLDDLPGSEITMPYIRSQCHRLYRQHEKLSLIVVDYLQLIGDQGSANRVGELGRYSAGLKSLAKEFDCPVLALSQLSRGVEGRNDKRPVMSDIRSSGAIEQDADVILMLYRDEYYNSEDTTDPGILEIIVAKNRHGNAGVTAKAEFDPTTGTIAPYVNYTIGAP